jgi:hypothetical protein
MSNLIKCFMIEPVGQYAVKLARYVQEEGGCPNCEFGCGAVAIVDVVKWDGILGDGRQFLSVGLPIHADLPFQMEDPVTSRLDRRWPKVCDHCGAQFPAESLWMVKVEALLKRVDGQGDMFAFHDAAPGAMYWADRAPHQPERGGKLLHVKLPTGQTWCIDGYHKDCDSPCSNCNRPWADHGSGCDCEAYEDAFPAHACWVRSGEAPNITVSKNGLTCGAGDGAIERPGYRGFLINGELRQH